MKSLLIIAFAVYTANVFAQVVIKDKRASGHSIHIWGSDFEGVTFKKNFEPFKSDSLGRRSFTPGREDIESAEALIRRNIDTAQCAIYGTGNELAKHLTCYTRQYFGYTNKRGEKVIWVNCFYKYGHIYPHKKEWLKKKVFVYDGGMAFWNATINLHTRAVYDLWINGI